MNSAKCISKALYFLWIQLFFCIFCATYTAYATLCVSLFVQITLLSITFSLTYVNRNATQTLSPTSYVVSVCGRGRGCSVRRRCSADKTHIY